MLRIIDKQTNLFIRDDFTFDEETEIEKAVFMDIMREARDFEEAKRKIIDYAYSGNWVHRKEEESA